MRCTGSISRGETAEKHNTRVCYRDEEHTPENIDFERRAQNVVLVNRSIEEVYHTSFGAALQEYNAKQVAKGHSERQIPDYLAKVREDKKLHDMYEFVIQCGNMEEHPDAETSAAVYRDFLEGFRVRYGSNFAVKQAIVHMDEAVPHMHLEVVPVARSKRGLSVQNSMNKAVTQSGHGDYKDMLMGWDEVLTGAMKEHGLTRIIGDKEKQMGGVDIDTYRRTKQAVKTSEDRLECLQQEIEEVQPLAVTFGESARTLWAARGDGEREEGFGVEIESLRERISGLERSNQRAREYKGELDRDIDRLGERVRAAREGCAALRERVTQLVRRARYVPDRVSEYTKEIAAQLGKRVMDRLGVDLERARSAAAYYNRTHGVSQRGRGIDR